MELEAPAHESYGAALCSAAGERLWQSGGLRPDDQDSLVVVIPSGLFAAGDYRLDVSAPEPSSPLVSSFALRLRTA